MRHLNHFQKIFVCFFVCFLALLFFDSCAKKTEMNPLLTSYRTPFETPPFDLIKNEHYLPAFMEGIRQHQSAVDQIVKNSDTPTFENTIGALEYSDELLDRVNRVFDNMKSAHTNDRIQAIAKEVAPLLSKNNDDVMLNPQLFQRIKQVYDNKDSMNLNGEQIRVLEKYYKKFARGGANLEAAQKERFREINKELALLELKFGENVLNETNEFKMVLEKKEDLAGLPDAVIAGAAETAEQMGLSGKWVFTIHKPSLIPFLQYSEIRPFREKMFKAYIMMGDHNDKNDNKKILSKIASLRVEKAKMLGYSTHSHFILEKNMARVPENVYKLLGELWTPALNVAKREAGELQELIRKEGGDFKLQPWDWWIYAEKLKKEKYDFDDGILRPYFQLKNVREGMFLVANKLFGLTFTPREDIPVYQKDVFAFEVKENSGDHLGILFMDFHPRASKRGGAWMSEYRTQYRKDGKNISPVITMVMNFSKPTGDQPALLSFDEVSTMFHEFGHALHGLLSDCTYKSLSGTNVAWDFVELPSQIMENWASHPEVLKLYAKHYETGEPIPDGLITKLKESSHFNQGFGTVEYLAASFLDMDWHTLTDTAEQDATEFEKKSMEKIGLIPEIVVRYRSTYFRHIFSGEYSSGYYSYIWAEVLDADAFEAFKANGVFDPATAKSLRENILERGDTEDPMVLFKRFRGAEPSIEPLLKKRGLK